MFDLDMYSRQDLLGNMIKNIDKIKSVAIIGVGGIGSHLALRLARIGIQTIYIIDPDTLEMSNVPRTPFVLQHVGREKVYALTDLIKYARHVSASTFKDIFSNFLHSRDERQEPYSLLKLLLSPKEIADVYHRIESSSPTVIRGFAITIQEFLRNNTLPEDTIIIDCTDRYFDVENEEDQVFKDFLQRVDWKLNYDALDFSITSNPYTLDEDGEALLPLDVMTQGNGYNATPSFFITPDFLTSLFISRLLMGDDIRETDVELYQVNLNDVVSSLFAKENRSLFGEKK